MATAVELRGTRMEPARIDSAEESKRAAPTKGDESNPRTSAEAGDDKTASRTSPDSVVSAGDEAVTAPLPLPVFADQSPEGRGARSLKLLVFLAVLYTLYFARAILLPIALGVVLSLLLRPIVRWLSRRRIPESVGAAFCLLTLLVLVGVGVFQMVGPAKEWLTDVPKKLEAAESKIKGLKSKFSELTQAKAKIEHLTEGEQKALEVQVQQPTLSSNVVLLSTTGSMLASIGLVIVLTYFLLTSGDQLINNILSTMPTFREKRQVVELIQNVQKGVSTYLFAVTMINAGLGVAVALAMWPLGIPNPALWGLMIALLNFIPYVGALITGLTIAVVAVLTFDSIAYACVAPLVFFAITTIEGQIITPAFLGRHMSLNPIMVFLFLTFWGWMWGVGGAVLAVPILAITRIACDQFEQTRPMGTMLSG